MTQPVTLQSPQFCIVVIDLTTDATPTNLKPGQDLIDAAMEQVTGPLRQAYGDFGGVAMRLASSPTDRASNEIAANCRDTLDVPGALAFHQTLNGIEDIEIGCDLFTSRGDDSEGLACGFTHELGEMLRDEGANDWRDLQDGSNQTRAGEICDRVQNTGYKASNGLFVTNFLLRSFFIPGASPPYDWLGLLTNQSFPSTGDTLGYEIGADAPTNVQQYTGKLGCNVHGGKVVCIHGDLTALQKKRKAHRWSRTYRRGIRL